MPGADQVHDGERQMPTKPMDELEELIGTSLRTVEEFSIEPGKVAEFAGAIHNTDPIHRDEEAARQAGHERIPAPPTFLMVKQFPRHRADPDQEEIPFDLGLDLEQVLHGEQEFEFDRPVYVGDVLSGETTLTDIYRKGSMTFAVLETEYYAQTGEGVAIDRTTLIERGGDVNE
jgi:acyl dehydratase